MNATQVLEVLIPMLVMLVTFVGLALRVQTNLGRSLDESIDKFRTKYGRTARTTAKHSKTSAPKY